MIASTPFSWTITLLPSREVAVALGDFTVRWYGLAYVAAFVLAWRMLSGLQHYRQLTLPSSDWLTVVTWGAAGAMTGGRLGYAVLYEPGYFLQHPWQVLVLSGGGMSAHGGFIGAAVGLWLAARLLAAKRQRSALDVFWRLGDIAAVPAGFGIGLGRIANFINAELYTSALGFLAGAVEGVVPAGLAWWHLRRGAAPGKPAGIFVAGYAGVRFMTEYLRVQPLGLFAGLTPGQWYSLPLLVAGMWLLLRRRTQP